MKRPDREMQPWDVDDFDEDVFLYDRFAKDNTFPWLVFLASLAVLILGSAAVLTFVERADAHDWYDISCCSGHDCRPISGIRNGEPWSEIADMGDHYLWQSSQTGETHRIEKDFRNIKPSRDGFYHGCELKQVYAQGHRVQCLYVPVMF